MATGYHVVQPNGIVKKQRAASQEERQELVTSLTEKWSGYCENNWISPNCDDPFSPENKVKQFLSNLGYFLIQGDTEGVETDYRRIMRGSREIPISSCPSYIEDAVYSTGPSLKTVGNADVFEVTLDAVDAKAEKLVGYYKRPVKAPRKKKRSRLAKSMAVQKAHGLDSAALTHERVDTENCFCHRGMIYQIVGLPQYELASDSKEGYYIMDRVICVDISDSETLFYDMSMNLIPSENIFRK